MIRRLLGQAFPPHIAIVGQRDIGEDDVFLEGGQGVVVGLFGGARGDAEEAGFRVDRVEAGDAVGIDARLDPGDVVADGGDLPAVEGLWRDQHGEVGLAAGRREGGSDVGLFTFRRFDAEDEHVFGQPTLVAGHGRGDAQREALLAEQCVAAVAGTIGPDFAGFRVVNDVLDGRVARPLDVGLAGFERGADGVHARHELAIGAENVMDGLAHAGHGAHVDDNIRRIGNLDTDMGDR